MRRAAFLCALLATAATGCEAGTSCDDHADCPKGAKCRCDGDGRLSTEKRDANGDKILDSLRYRRDGAGRVVAIESDWGDNGSIDRLQEFTYDEQGRRVKNEGWLAQCEGSKFRWSCNYDKPCEPPYEKCPPCRNTYEIESDDGKIKPCGKQPKGAGSGG